MGVTQAAGLSLRWFRDTFIGSSTGAPESYDHLTAEAAKIPPGSDGLLWTPYLMGERTPHLDGSARGALVGLTASHTRGHIVRAIPEGVAFSLRDTFTLFQEMNVPVEASAVVAGAPAHRFGGKFRPTSAIRSKPKKAPLMVPHFLPRLAPASGPP